MSNKIVIVNPALTADHRERIAYLARKGGYEAVFFETNQEALPAMEDAVAAYGLGADLTAAGKQLAWFHSMSAGVDGYLQEGAIANPGMLLTSSSGAYGVTLAEHTLMVTLELLRRQPEYEQAVAQKKWLRGLKQRTIKDSAVTIVGTGDLGGEIAKRFAAFEPEHLFGVNRSGLARSRAFTRIVKQEKVDRILPDTDILVMALPGTSETYHFLNRERLALLPDSAIVVNVGRGNAVDQDALAQALKDGKLSAAALDVFEKEPLPADDPLWDCPNLLITPHIAGDLTAPYTLEKNVEFFCDNLCRFINGQPLERIVDRRRGY